MSTARCLEPARRRALLRVGGWLLAAFVLAKVSQNLWRALVELRAQPLRGHPQWITIAASGLVFLLAHGVLIATWRTVLSCWGERLPFWSAARVWSVSNLGRYVPGKIWQIGAMGAMARELKVSPIAASGSALLGTLVNVAAGFVVALVSGHALLLSQVPAALRALAVAVIVAAVASLLLLPFAMPRVADVASRISGRPLEATLPMRAVVYSLIGNVIAWLVYGAAFRLFMSGVLGRATGGYPGYLAAYTSSYLIGYIFLFAPAGVGFRDLAMLELLQLAGLASRPEAVLVMVTSRIWLTLLEVVPALFFWTHHRMRGRLTTLDRSDASS
jgi:hypothetical protein